MFDTRDEEHVKPLLDSTEQVLAALHEAGVEAFPAYGTLLGAIREQNFIGHDNDVDLGYVSRHTHPLDVIRESFRLQRTLREQGYAVDRYSAAAFKVDVVEADGGVRGLDVFGGYFLDGRLYLMGEIGTPFQEDWIFPLGTCTLAGRTLPAPARPEKLLEATYGPGWKVPDPAFHFETPRTTYRRLNGWFRGGRAMRNEWDRRFSMLRETMPTGRPSALARYVAEQEPDLARLVDVGAGRARRRAVVRATGRPDARARLRLGRRQRRTPRRGRGGRAAGAGLDEPATSRARCWPGAPGWRGSRSDPCVMANHLLDAIDQLGVESFVRFARMSLSGGGRLYADFYALQPGEDRYRPDGPDATGSGPSDAERRRARVGAERSRYRAQHSGRGDDHTARVRGDGSSGGAIGGGMAEVTSGGERRGFKDRAVERVARAVAGDRLDELQQRIEELEAEVQECRQLNIRLAEVTDLVEQLLLPIAAQDQEKIAAAVEKYTRTL